MIGKTISHYKILEKLGGGGMGVVYRATDLKLNRTVALKFLPPELLRDPEAKKRFIREAQAASSLQHDNTCVIHDIEETNDGQLFIVMEFYKGETLKKKIERGPLPIEKTIHYASQITRGLACAHESNMIHRDIKPANIMITDSDEVKIVDFGLAHLGGHSQITKDGSTLGTIDYMSPEQTAGKKIDHRTDIWSLGVVLYEMATGERPFKGDYDQAVMYSILNENPDPPSSIRSNIPLALDTTVRKALEKEPTKRYQRATDMLADLKHVLSGFKERRFYTLIRIFRQRRWIAWGLVLLAIITAFLLSVFGPVTISVRELEASNNSIAVMICENRIDPDDKDRLAEIITDALITDLMESQYLQVVSLQRLYDILKQMGKTGKRVIDKNEQLEVAKRSGVARIITPSIGQLGSQYILSAQCIEVQTGDVIHSLEILGSIENISPMIDSLSTQIMMNLGLPEDIVAEQNRFIADVTTHSTEAYRHYLAGEELVARYEMLEAIQEYKKAVTLDSTFATAFSRLAAVYRFLRYKEDTEYALNKAFRHIDHIKERERYEVHYQRALEENKIDQAKTILFNWIERYHDDKLARFHLGDLYSDYYYMFDEAILQFKSVIELDNDYRLAYNSLGYAYAYKGMKDKAIDALKKYLSLCPNEVNPYDSLAEIYMNLIGDYTTAEHYFKTAVQLNPHFAPHKLAELYQLMGRYQKAEEILSDILAKETLVVSGIKYFLLARLHYEKGEFEKTIYFLDTAEKLLPSYKNIYWLSGLTYLKMNNLQEAEKNLAKLKKIDPEEKNYFHLSGHIHLAKENYPEAWQAIQHSINMIHFIAWIYYEHREYYKYTLAEAYLSMGKTEDAIRVCQEIITDNPNWAKSHYLLGRIYEQNGSVNNALKSFKTFLEIWQDADKNLPEIIYAEQQIQSYSDSGVKDLKF
jgi:serine/threonine protein kinase/predicted Zn-dependent protease